MGGCKGVLALDPTLGEEDCIVIRPSMEKFECDEKKLEAMYFAKPRKHCCRLALFVMYTVDKK